MYRLYMNHPVNAPTMPPPIMLAQLIAFVLASIFSPLLAIAANRDPMKMCIINLGVTMAVASAYTEGFTVGTVDIAPFEIEYGSGHNLIMHRSFKPSCLSTKDSAANLLSFATSRWTKFVSKVLETMKEHVDPITVAVAAMNQLSGLHGQQRKAISGKTQILIFGNRANGGAYPSQNPYTKPAIVRHVE